MSVSPGAVKCTGRCMGSDPSEEYVHWRVQGRGHGHRGCNCGDPLGGSDLLGGITEVSAGHKVLWLKAQGRFRLPPRNLLMHLQGPHVVQVRRAMVPVDGGPVGGVHP